MGSALKRMLSGAYSALSTGFQIVGGTTSKTLTVSGTMTLNGYATAAEINTGTEPAKAIAPDQLRAAGIPAILQRAYAEYTTNADLTTVIPNDDTIPQNTEGTEILTVSITPKLSSSRIRIRFQGMCGVADTNQRGAIALFVDTTANALAAASGMVTSSATLPVWLLLEYEEASASTSARTYKIRVGGSGSSVIRMNGLSNGRLFGGVARTTMIVEEVL